ncbi:site-2 protease family protein [soil metagenome]
MFGTRFKIFRLLGFDIYLDASWFLLAFLIVWSLGGAAFPESYPGLAPATYWLMGVAGALGLFLSIILHELGHAVVARRYGIPMRGITLFIFGGVAEMGDEPPDAKSEFFMAIGGPVVSVLIAGSCLGLAAAGDAAGAGLAITGVFEYLGWINGILVLFNMIPAFPLDGGRVLRSALWAWKGKLRWATKVAAGIGSGFGILLMAFGLLSVFGGNIIGGIWLIIIAFFIRTASRMSYQQVLLRRALDGEPVSRFMNPAPISVPAGISVHDLVENYIYRHHRKMFPVTRNEGQDLVGCVTFSSVKSIPKDEWESTSVQSITVPTSDENTVRADTDAMKALSRMNNSKASRLMVVNPEGRLVGVLALKDLLAFLSLKIELEGTA